MTRLAANPKAVAAPPAVVSASMNTVRGLFDRVGDLEALVARRVANSSDVFKLQALKSERRNYVAAIGRLDTLPAPSDLARQIDRLRAATFAAATEDEASFIIGTMLDAIPAAANRLSATYVDALVWAVLHADDDRDPSAFPKFRGFSVEVLASAARHIWLTVKYAPAIQEVVDAADKARARHHLALNTTLKIASLRENADAVVSTVEAAEPMPEDPDAIPF